MEQSREAGYQQSVDGKQEQDRQGWRWPTPSSFVVHAQAAFYNRGTSAAVTDVVAQNVDRDDFPRAST